MSALSIVAWVVLVIDVVLVGILITQWRNQSRRVRLAVLIPTMAIMPVALAIPAAQADIGGMETTTFCASCHEMGPYAKSLASVDEESVPALHHQNNYVPQTTACYACHTDYAPFGQARAKLNGIRHMYVHYVSGAPATLKLYRPYNTQNCLHCHGPSKAFLEAKTHTRRTTIADMQSGKKSCLDCHDVGHVKEVATR